MSNQLEQLIPRIVSRGLLKFRETAILPRLADQAWLLLQIGLGGYVVGRSVEKISPQIQPKLPVRKTGSARAKGRSDV